MTSMEPPFLAQASCLNTAHLLMGLADGVRGVALGLTFRFCLDASSLCSLTSVEVLAEVSGRGAKASYAGEWTDPGFLSDVDSLLSSPDVASDRAVGVSLSRSGVKLELLWSSLGLRVFVDMLAH